MPVNSVSLVQTSSIDLEKAKGVLETLQVQVNAGLRYIKIACTEDGKLNSELLDNYQFASYELAFCVAEISAAHSFFEYANRADENAIEHSFSLIFAGEIFQSVLSRLKSISVDVQLDAADIFTLESTDNAKLLLTNCNGGTLAALGSKIAQDEIVRLPSILNAEKELVRETFYRFANDVVAHQAEDVHRQYKDITEKRIRAAAE